MSRTRPLTLTCPECQASLQAEVVESVNVDRDPQLRDAILEGTFQRFDCACGVSIQLEPEALSYLDVGRKQWLVFQPHGNLADWRAQETGVQTLFDQALGSQASAPAQELGRGISPRLVFGWPALREKLLARELGLDDVGLECVKLALIKDQGIVPEAGQELRLSGRRGEALVLEHLDVSSRDVLHTYGVPQGLYQEISADSGWASLVAQLSAGPFVDVQRLWLGEG